MRSERKCSIFDLLWPDPSIPEGESEKFVFLEKKNIFEEKKYTVILVLLGSTCVQNLRQFEFLTLAIKISFLFDFCTDVLLISIKIQFRISGIKRKPWQKSKMAAVSTPTRHVQNCKYNSRAKSFEQFDLFHILAFDLTSKHHNNIINDVASQLKQWFSIMA